MVLKRSIIQESKRFLNFSSINYSRTQARRSRSEFYHMPCAQRTQNWCGRMRIGPHWPGSFMGERRKVAVPKDRLQPVKGGAAAPPEGNMAVWVVAGAPDTP